MADILSAIFYVFSVAVFTTSVAFVWQLMEGNGYTQVLSAKSPRGIPERPRAFAQEAASFLKKAAGFSEKLAAFWV